MKNCPSKGREYGPVLHGFGRQADWGVSGGRPATANAKSPSENILTVREAQHRQSSAERWTRVTWSVQAGAEEPIRCKGCHTGIYSFTGTVLGDSCWDWYMSGECTTSWPQPCRARLQVSQWSGRWERERRATSKPPKDDSELQRLSITNCGKGTAQDQGSSDRGHILGATGQWIQVWPTHKC